MSTSFFVGDFQAEKSFTPKKISEDFSNFNFKVYIN